MSRSHLKRVLKQTLLAMASAQLQLDPANPYRRKLKDAQRKQRKVLAELQHEDEKHANPFHTCPDSLCYYARSGLWIGAGNPEY